MERTIPVEGPLDLRATLRPLHGRFAADGWWWTSRTESGPATLRLTRSKEGIHGEAWGPGATILLERLGGYAGLDDDPSRFQTDHSVVSELARRNPGLRFGRVSEVFAPLVHAVVGQKVTGTEAARGMRGLVKSFSEPAPGPFEGLRLPPDPEQMKAAAYWQFHELHLEKKRADVLRALSSKASQVDEQAALPPEVAASGLIGLRGVGVWTVAETLVRSHGDPDQVPVGDFHVKNMVVYHLTGKPRGTDEEMLELLDEFRPHRGRALRLIHTLGHAPAFGPRSVPRNFTAY